MRALILAPFSDDRLARLRRRGDVVHESWLDTGRLQDPAALGARLASDRFDVLVVEADFVFEEVFEQARELRLVGICRNALNQVDVAAATAHGVAITHAPGRNTNAWQNDARHDGARAPHRTRPARRRGRVGRPDGRYRLFVVRIADSTWA
jgi:D-3-phosphoglycerate dehydrogenase